MVINNRGVSKLTAMKQQPSGSNNALTSSAITNVFVQTSVREQRMRVLVEHEGFEAADDAYLQIEITELDGKPAGPARVQSRLSDLPQACEIDNPDADQDTASQMAKDAALGSTSTAICSVMTVPWENPRLWGIGTPYLYMLYVKVVDAEGQVLASYKPVRFGFREVWTEGRDLIINGRPVKLRIAPYIENLAQAYFYEGMGFNTMIFQPHPNVWDDGFPTTVMQAASAELLDFADERGWAVLLPLPSINKIKSLDPETTAKYLNSCRAWVRQLDRQNRPSIIVWLPSMNLDGTICPTNLTIRSDNDWGRIPLFNAVNALLKSKDPTRLIVHHHGGAGTGDIEMSNVYLCFLPLQEREEWLSYWSENGRKPWGVADFGTPYTGNFFKVRLGDRLDGTPYFTEYSAMYLGDRAYELEKDDYIHAIRSMKEFEIPHGMKPNGIGFILQGYLQKIGEWTGYYEFMDLFIRQTYKSWRAWGMNAGTLPWIMDVGFGIQVEKYELSHGRCLPNNHVTAAELKRMIESKVEEGIDRETALLSLKQRPEWANPIYDAYRDVSQPLMVFIGGPRERFTAKDHSFTSGETVEMTIVAIWDGPGDKSIDVDWKVTSRGYVLAYGTEAFNLSQAAVEKRPIHFDVPDVSERTDAELEIVVRDPVVKNSDAVSIDRMKMAFFPPTAEVEGLRSNWAIYDPVGKSTDELTKLGVKIRPIAMGDSLEGVDVLVIGSEALDDEHAMPFTPEDVEKGLRVIVLEQTAEALEVFGFRAEDVVPRYVFPRVDTHPVLRGVAAEDLINWRGEGKLVPKEKENYYPYPDHRLHWGNYGSVASVIIETPQKGAFTPLLEAEFDLSYSPLLEWRHGEGLVLFSQLDFTGRIGLEPVASILLKNMIEYMDGLGRAAGECGECESAQCNRVLYVGSDACETEYLQSLGFEFEAVSRLGGRRINQDQLVVLGKGMLIALDDNEREILAAHVKNGGKAMVLPHSREQLEGAEWPWQLKTRQASIARIRYGSTARDSETVTGIGPQLLHWRDFLDLTLFESDQQVPGARALLDGLVLEVKDGQGCWVFSQMDWRQLDENDENVRLPRWNTARFYRQLLTNLGARTSSDVALKMFYKPSDCASMVPISQWKAYEAIDMVPWEPFFKYTTVTLRSLESGGLDQLFDSEACIKVKSEGSRGKILWAADDGYVKLPGVSERGSVSYAMTYVYSDTGTRIRASLI